MSENRLGDRAVAQVDLKVLRYWWANIEGENRPTLALLLGQAIAEIEAHRAKDEGRDVVRLREAVGRSYGIGWHKEGKGGDVILRFGHYEDAWTAHLMLAALKAGEPIQPRENVG